MHIIPLKRCDDEESITQVSVIEKWILPTEDDAVYVFWISEVVFVSVSPLASPPSCARPLPAAPTIACIVHRWLLSAPHLSGMCRVAR